MEYRDLKRQYEHLKNNIDRAISGVLDNCHFISGSHVKELETKLAEYVGVKHCITCANGTDAITIALKAWGISENDVVFVPDFTFFSSGECPACEGAKVIFVDVDERTYNISTDKLEKEIIKVINEQKYTPKVVISVDLFGLPANYDEINRICEKYNLLLLEDGAQGFGGSLHGKKACSFGDISTTSFFPAKPLGCYGDGGAIFTDNDEWADFIRSICVHGKDTSNPNDPNAKYNNVRLGMNSRLDTLQASILIEKFNALVEFELDEVNKIAVLYSEYLKDSPFVLPLIPDDYYSCWAQYTIQLPENIDRKDLQKHLKSKDIPTMVYYEIPMHKQIAFKNTESEIADCKITDKLCKTVISLPLHPYMKKEEVEHVCNELKQYILLRGE